MTEKRKAVERLRRELQGNTNSFSEQTKKFEFLKSKKTETLNALSNCRVEEQQQLAKLDRAEKAVKKNLQLLEKKKLFLDINCNEYFVLVGLIQENLKKTINAILWFFN